MMLLLPNYSWDLFLRRSLCPDSFFHTKRMLLSSDPFLLYIKENDYGNLSKKIANTVNHEQKMLLLNYCNAKKRNVSREHALISSRPQCLRNQELVHNDDESCSLSDQLQIIVIL